MSFDTWVYLMGSGIVVYWFAAGRWIRRQMRQRILEETLKKDGPEARKAMEARLKGEWR